MAGKEGYLTPHESYDPGSTFRRSDWREQQTRERSYNEFSDIMDNNYQNLMGTAQPAHLGSQSEAPTKGANE